MKFFSMCILVIVFSCFNVFASRTNGEPTASCSLFLLKKSDSDLMIERVELADNETQVIPITKSGENITVILSYGVGKSGDFIKLDMSKFMIARCLKEELQIKVRDTNGNERELPAMSSATYSQYDIRVSVTGKSLKKAFLIQQGKVSVDKDSPVFDMFAGRIPIGENDYSIGIETSERITATSIQGEAPLEYDRYLFTKAKITGDAERLFAVDMAASQTVIAKSVLPSSVKITKANSVEYSDKGRRVIDYAASGAGGAVAGLYFADVPEIKSGNMTFANQSLVVAESLPKLAGREIAGIIGLDLLQRAKRVSFGYAKQPAANKLVFSDKSLLSAKDVIELPFTVAFSSLYVKGFVGDAAVDFVIDTGAPDCVITWDVANTAKITNTKKTAMPIKGLDGKPLEAHSATIEQLKLNSYVYVSTPVIIADLPIFQQRGLKNAGLLGNTFFQQFKFVEVDFAQKILRLQK